MVAKITALNISYLMWALSVKISEFLSGILPLNLATLFFLDAQLCLLNLWTLLVLSWLIPPFTMACKLSQNIEVGANTGLTLLLL